MSSRASSAPRRTWRPRGSRRVRPHRRSPRRAGCWKRRPPPAAPRGTTAPDSSQLGTCSGNGGGSGGGSRERVDPRTPGKVINIPTTVITIRRIHSENRKAKCRCLSHPFALLLPVIRQQVAVHDRGTTALQYRKALGRSTAGGGSPATRERDGAAPSSHTSHAQMRVAPRFAVSSWIPSTTYYMLIRL